MREGAEAEEATLTQDDLFSILRNQRRRAVLQYLHEVDGKSDLREMSERVAAWENDCQPNEVTYRERKRVQTALYQIHLPKLDEWGVVDYDQRAGTVRIRDRAETCLSLLDDPEASGAWWKRYLGIAVLGAGVTLLAALGVPPFDGVPAFGYAALLGGVFVSLSFAYVVVSRRGVSV